MSDRNPDHEQYENQLRLLLDVLPWTMKDSRLALKGGTAINLFVRDMPRFSIDIDLTYLPVESRAESISNINDILEKMAKEIESKNPRIKVKPTKSFESGKEIKLLVIREDIFIKIEVNYLLRGSLHPPLELMVAPSCRARFARSVSAHVMSFEDLYGGKLCAALDRQHPRDLFDIKLLFENEGLTKKTRQSFLV